MARFACLAWAVLVAGCVDLTQPLELRGRDLGAPLDEADAALPTVDGAVVPEDSLDSSDAARPQTDAPVGATAPDSAPPADSPADAAVTIADAAGPDLSPPDAPLLGNGKACTAAGQCQTGLCVDGVCCNLP